MAESTPFGIPLHTENKDLRPSAKLYGMLLEERKDILFILLYGILSGLVNLSLPLGVQAIITRISGGLFFESVYVLIGLVMLGVALSGGLQVLQITLVEVIQKRIFAKTAFRFTMAICRLRYGQMEGKNMQELMNRFFDVITIQKGLPKLLIDLSSALIQIFFGLLLLSFYHPFFIFLSFFLVLFIVVLFRLTGSEGMRTSMKESTYKYQVVHWLEEMARMRNLVRTWPEEQTVQKADSLVGEYLGYRRKHFKILVTQYVTILVLKFIIVGSMLILGSMLVVDRKITLGQFVASELIIVTLVGAVEKIILYMDVVYDLLTGVEKISTVTTLQLENGGGALPPQTQGPATITVKGLNLKSKTKDILSFKDFTTELAPGQVNTLHFDEQEKVAGFIELLLGIPETFDGAVLVDGLPIREIDKAKWRREVSVYTGSDDLTFGTLRENIVYNAGEGGIEKVISILHEMGIADLVFSAADGLNALSLPGGQNLNGRIAELFPFAIMLAREPRLLIIKDSIQNLSPEEKILLIDYIRSKSAEITVLVFSSDETWAAA